MPKRARTLSVTVLTTGNEPSMLLLAALLSQSLSLRGLQAVAAGVAVLRTQGHTLAAWLARRRPLVVLCIVTPPYEAMWAELAEAAAAHTSRGGILLALAADVEALRACAPGIEVHALQGSSGELDAVVALVESAVRATSAGDGAPSA